MSGLRHGSTSSSLVFASPAFRSGLLGFSRSEEPVPDKPIPDDDPIVSKSLAPHYVVAVILLMATLFWALWDEDFGQRPWKAFQQEWKSRYSTFLTNARTQSGDSQTEG